MQDEGKLDSRTDLDAFRIKYNSGLMIDQMLRHLNGMMDYYIA